MSLELIQTISGYIIIGLVAGIILLAGLYFIQKRKEDKQPTLSQYIQKSRVSKRKNPKKKLAYLNIIIIGKGLNYRIRKLIDVHRAKKTLKVREKSYNINQDAFFLTNRNSISQMLHNLFKRKEEYTILFREDSPKPMLIDKPKTGLTAGMLRTAEVSKVTQKALAELFSTQLPGRKILFLIAVIGILAAVYLVATGQLNLGL